MQVPGLGQHFDSSGNFPGTPDFYISDNLLRNSRLGDPSQTQSLDRRLSEHHSSYLSPSAPKFSSSPSYFYATEPSNSQYNPIGHSGQCNTPELRCNDAIRSRTILPTTSELCVKSVQGHSKTLGTAPEHKRVGYGIQHNVREYDVRSGAQKRSCSSTSISENPLATLCKWCEKKCENLEHETVDMKSWALRQQKRRRFTVSNILFC